MKPALAGVRIITSVKSVARYAGFGSLMGVNPGFRSLRSLHPGLNSAASFAGSLAYYSTVQIHGIDFILFEL